MVELDLAMFNLLENKYDLVLSDMKIVCVYFSASLMDLHSLLSRNTRCF